MNFKKELIKKRKQLDQLRSEIIRMEKECIHEEYSVVLTETLAFEFSPRKKCKLCYAEIAGMPSAEEIKFCYKQEFEDLFEKEYSEDEITTFYTNNPLGYNLPRPKLGKH